MTRRSRPWGFTLIEILVAMAIMAAIVSILYGSYIGASGSIQRFRQSSTALQTAHLALHQLGAQIRCAYVPENTLTSSSNDDNLLRPGQDSIQLNADPPIFRGTNGPQGDMLKFVTRKSLFPEQSQVPICWTITVSLDREGGQLILLQQPYSKPTHQKRLKSRCLVLADRVTRLTLAYYDGARWQNNWNNQECHGLPLAVRCKLTIQDIRDTFYTASIVVPVFCAMPARETAVMTTSL